MPGTNEALADAFSGVIGTLVSLWCFYPIERWKTNVQAGRDTSRKEGLTADKECCSLQAERSVQTILQSSFRGCGTKSLHATSSSFCYFYFYSRILSAYNRSKQQGSSNHNNNNHNSSSPLRPSTRLLLAAMAAMMNTFVTLPLDVLSSKKTVEQDDKNEPETDTTNNNNNNNNNNNQRRRTTTKAKTTVSKHESACATACSTFCSSSASSSSSSSSSSVEVVFHEACSRSEDLFSLHEEPTIIHDDHNNDDENNNNTSRCSNSTSSNSILSYNEEYKNRWHEKQEERRKNKRNTRSSTLPQTRILSKYISNINSNSSINSAITISMARAMMVLDLVGNYKYSKLWKGLAPALLLCSNPSIHYTVFDMLKTKLLVWKRLNNTQRHKQQQQQQLSVSEAFVLGLVSKFVATIVTYPLIRAKVLMMVRTDDDDDNEDGSSSPSPSLWSVLQESYFRDGGIKGLYKGCDWQLLHTLLKSALMMAIREQITDTSRAFFRVKPAIDPK